MSMQNPKVVSSRRIGALLVGALGVAGACGAAQSGPPHPGIPSRPTDVQAAIKSNAEKDRELRAVFAEVPMRFEKNQGQVDPAVRFTSRGSGYSLFLTDAEAVLSLSKRENPNAKIGTAPEKAVVRMGLVGASRKAQVSPVGPQHGRSNYFRGNNRGKWHRDIPNFGKVQYDEVYPGVDLVFYGKQRELEYDFIVAPGADASRIRMEFSDLNRQARRPELSASGDLVLPVDGGEVVQKKPYAYQTVNGKQRPVACDFVIDGKHNVGFRLAEYDPKLPLVIDPILTFATYLGGTQEDEALAVCSDAFGNVYVTGRTESNNFPLRDAYQDTRFGDDDLFLTKINAAGCEHVYSTYLGGATAQNGFDRADDKGAGVAVDAAGNLHVVGSTSCTDFPTSAGALQQSVTGAGGDGFVAKLNPQGNDFLYSTYLGGDEAGLDGATAVAIGFKGHAYVVGSTGSPSFPTTPGTIQPEYGGGPSDGFIAKVALDGQSLVWSTFLGGGESRKSEGADYIHDIELDPNNVHDSILYVTGKTNAYDFPLYRPFQIEVRKFDAFVTKIDEGGDRILYSTYLGGLENDEGNGITVDNDGSVYVAGTTASKQFNNMPDPVQKFSGGDSDAWFAKLHPKATHALYFSYFGGKGTDFATGIAVDANKNAYVVGGMNFPNADTVVTSANGPTPRIGEGDGFSAPRKGDAFLLTVAPTVPRVASRFFKTTILGGMKDDQANAVCLNPHGDLLIAGATESLEFNKGRVKPVQADLRGASDGFVAKVSIAPYGRVAVAPGGLGFSAQVGGSQERSLVIRNTSRKSVGVTVIPPSAPFEIVSGGGQFVLARGSRRTLKVRFRPVDAGLVRDEMQIVSTSAGPEACKTIKLSGRGR